MPVARRRDVRARRYNLLLMLRSLLVLLLLATSAFAQARFECWPGATYDHAIPTMRKVVGYDTGDRLVAGKHREVLRRPSGSCRECAAPKLGLDPKCIVECVEKYN